MRIVIIFSFTFLLTACGGWIDKTKVTKNSPGVDQNGEMILEYSSCNYMNLVSLDPYCKKEIHKPKYCYRSLGDIVCYETPLKEEVAKDRRVYDSSHPIQE